MSMWILLLILLAVALVATLVGYKNYIWFLSVGYGLAIAALGAATLQASPTASVFSASL